MKRSALPLAALVAAPVLAALAGARGPVRVSFNLGPGDAPYISGFMPEYEIWDRVATQWTTRDATIELPLRVRGGPASVSYRLVRDFPDPGEVDVWLAGAQIDRFTLRGRFEERRVSLGALAPTPLRVRFKVDAPDADRRGLRLDWMRLEAGPGTQLRLDGPARWRAALLVAFLFLLLRGAGWGPRAAAGLTAPWTVAATLGLLTDPWLVHRLLTAVPEWLAGLGLVGIGVGRWLLARGRVEPDTLRTVTALTACAFLLRALALNHPGFYYPDLRSHVQLVEVVRGAGWDFLLSPARYILKHGVWSRTIHGVTYPFPYTPAFHVPFALSSLSYDSLITAVKLGAAAFSTVPIAALWVVGRRLGASALGVALMLLIPIYAHHLALVYLAAVFGHAVDMTFLAWLSGRLQRTTRLRVWLAAAAFVALCQLAYISSVILLPVFLATLAATEAFESRREGFVRGLAILGFGVTGSFMAFLAYYRDFLGTVFAALHAAPGDVSDSAPVQGFLALVYSYNQRYFDGLFPILAACGLTLLLRRGRERVLPAAWLATYALLLLGRAKLPVVFQHPHDALFVAPLVCLAAGEALARLASGGGWRRGLAGLLLAALTAQGLWLQWQAVGRQLANAL